MKRDTLGAGCASAPPVSHSAHARRPDWRCALSRESRRRIFDRIVWLAGAFFLIALAVDAAAGVHRAPGAGIAASPYGIHADGDRHEQG